MSNIIDSTGLTVNSVTDIQTNITNSFKTIYGNDINVESSSPDGQLINILAQAIVDNLELLNSIYNSFSPDNCYGKTMDQRFAINGLERIGGTFTFTNITLVTDRALNLEGLDGNIESTSATGYTISDGEGNQFILAESISIPSAGTYVLSFRSKTIGKVQTLPNTITNMITIVLGVVSVNNPTTASIIGIDEESDYDFRVRRMKSFALASTSNTDSIMAELLRTTGVTDCYIYENSSDSSVGSIPAHSLWIIVQGGTDANVANAIYIKKSPGCNLYGDESYSITRVAGNTITINFDRAIEENLYIQFNLTPKTAGIVFDLDAIKTSIVNTISYKLYQNASINDIIIAMSTIEPNGVLSSVGVSTDGVTYAESVSPTDEQHKFILDVSRIDITL